MSNKRGLSGIYLILIVFGIALLWTLGLGILAREEESFSNILYLTHS